LSKVIRVKYEKGVLKPLDNVDFEEGEELLVKVVSVERKRKVLRKYRGVLGSASKELLDRFMLEAEEQ
jgi:predicted DNA-binding antitoxin AbrB/MazE fold protein